MDGRLITIGISRPVYDEAVGVAKIGSRWVKLFSGTTTISFTGSYYTTNIQIGRAESAITNPSKAYLYPRFSDSSDYYENTIYSDEFTTSWHVMVNGTVTRLSPTFTKSWLAGTVRGLTDGDVYTIYSDPIRFCDDGYIVINTWDYDNDDMFYCAYDDNGNCYEGRRSNHFNVIHIPRKGNYTIKFERVWKDAPNNEDTSATNDCKIFVIGTKDVRSIEQSEITYISGSNTRIPNLYKIGTPVTFKLNLRKQEKIRFEFISAGMFWSPYYTPIIKIYSGQQSSLLTTVNLDNRSQSTGIYEYTSGNAGEYTFSITSSIAGSTVGNDNSFYICRIVQEGYKGSEQILSAVLSKALQKYGEVAPTLTVSGAKTSLSYKSSNANVARVDASGKLSIVGCGDTTITVTAAETSDWYAATATLKLSVGKGSLTVKAAPSGSNIVYGQTLSNSRFTGGTVTNSAGTGVGGNWSWKTPAATPSVGKQTFIARYTPTDTAHYEY